MKGSRTFMASVCTAALSVAAAAQAPGQLIIRRRATTKRDAACKAVRTIMPIPTVMPMPRIDEDRNPRPRRPKHKADRALEAYFAVMTILILGMIIGLAAYTVQTVIPELEKSRSPMSPGYPINVQFQSHL